MARSELVNREHRGEAPGRFDGPLGAGQPVGGEQGRGQAVLGGPSDVEGLAHGPEHLPEPRGLGGGRAQGPAHAPAVQSERAAGCGCGTEDPGGGGDVPADVVMVGVHGVADAAFHLHPEDQRMEEVAAGDGPVLGQGQQRCGHRPGGMDDGPQVGVVEVEHVGAQAVEQRRMQRIDPFRAAQHRRPGFSHEGSQGLQRDVHRFVARAAHRAAHPVEQRARGFAAHGVGDGAKLRLTDPLRQASGHSCVRGAHGNVRSIRTTGSRRLSPWESASFDFASLYSGRTGQLSRVSSIPLLDNVS